MSEDYKQRFMENARRWYHEEAKCLAEAADVSRTSEQRRSSEIFSKMYREWGDTSMDSLWRIGRIDGAYGRTGRFLRWIGWVR